MIRRPGCGTLSTGGRSFYRARLPGWPRHVRAWASCARLISVRTSPSVPRGSSSRLVPRYVSVRDLFLELEPPIGSTPMTYALRETRSLPAHALAAPIARVMARMALAALGLSGDPVHARGRTSPHPATVRNVADDMDPRPQADTVPGRRLTCTPPRTLSVSRRPDCMICL